MGKIKKSRAVKPSWKALHRAGAEIIERIDGVMSFEEIAAELGLSCRQQAYHICCVAVGKLVHRVKGAKQ